MDDLKELLDAATPGPWALDEGGEVHKHGTTIFAWPKWSDQSNHGVIYANMSLGSLAPDLAAEVLRLRAEVERLTEAMSGIDVYLSDTLSGRVEPDPSTYKQWLIEGIVEARNRARAALKSKGTE